MPKQFTYFEMEEYFTSLSIKVHSHFSESLFVSPNFLLVSVTQSVDYLNLVKAEFPPCNPIPYPQKDFEFPIYINF